MGVQQYRDQVSAKKRNAILDAAVKVFARDGYERAGMDTIARQAKVSLATLYKHAESKSALFGNIVARAWDIGDTAGSDTLNKKLTGEPKKALVAIGDHYAKSLTDPKVVSLFRTIIGECIRFPELGRDLYERAKLPYLQRIERYLELQHADGNLHVVDARSATRQLLGMINDQVFWPRFLIAEFELSRAQQKQVVRQAVETLWCRVKP